MERYKIHFSGYYGYTVDVEAEDKEKALIQAEELYMNANPSEFSFEPEQTEIWKTEDEW